MALTLYAASPSVDRSPFLPWRPWIAFAFALALAGCRTTDAPSDGAVRVSPVAPSAPSSAPVDASLAPSDAGGEGEAGPPAGLACLARHYVGRPVRSASGWALALPDGAELPWDDGLPKTPAERLERPDLEDTLAIPYQTGHIVPISDEAHDPGRVRVEPLFRATYGAAPRDVSAALVDVKIAGHTVKFHRRAASALARVASRLDELLAAEPSLRPFFRALGGTFNARPIAGTNRTSAHAWGIAVDIDVSRSDYWRNGPAPVVWKNRVPQAIVDAFEAEGFVWGGRWFHYDTMHFEWRPELFDPQCGAPPAGSSNGSSLPQR